MNKIIGIRVGIQYADGENHEITVLDENIVNQVKDDIINVVKKIMDLEEEL